MHASPVSIWPMELPEAVKFVLKFSGGGRNFTSSWFKRVSKQHNVKIHNSVISDLPSGHLRILYIVHVYLENVNCLLSSSLETPSGCSSV